MFAKVAVDCRLAECTVCYVLQSCLLCTYRQYFSQSLLSLPTAAANDIHKFCALHLWKPLSATLLLYTKRSKYLQLISLQESSGTDLSTFCLFLCSPFFYPPLLSSPKALLSGPRNLAHSEKHSWKAFSPPDQGDFFIHSLPLLLLLLLHQIFSYSHDTRTLRLSSALHVYKWKNPCFNDCQKTCAGSQKLVYLIKKKKQKYNFSANEGMLAFFNWKSSLTLSDRIRSIMRAALEFLGM